VAEGSVTVVVVLGGTRKQSQALEINDCGTDCSPGMLSRERKDFGFYTLEWSPDAQDLCAGHLLEGGFPLDKSQWGYPRWK
jgi:hypothetical protein